MVHSTFYDEVKGNATGVRIIDGNTKEIIEFYAGVIFVNAPALNCNAILLNSISNRFPNGIGNDAGLLGKYISWHNYRGKGGAEYEGLKDKKTDRRNPCNSYKPRFRNLRKQEMYFLRGHPIGVGGGKGYSSDEELAGDQLRESLLHPQIGNWHISTWMMGECVPMEKKPCQAAQRIAKMYSLQMAPV